MAEVKPGDPVLYVPHESHALHRDFTGRYTFEMEWLQNPALPTQRWEKLEGKRIEDVLNQIRINPNGLAMKKNQLRFTRVLRSWNAKIREIHPDGTADLAIEDPMHPAFPPEHPDPGVTLLYDKVPHDPTGKRLHSWKAIEEVN